MLIHLISDLARKPELRREFDANPHDLIAKYEIPTDQQRTLLSRDTGKLELLLHADASLLLHKLLPSPVFFWPGNQLRINSVEPNKGNTGTRIDFTVTGDMFEPNATLTFQRPGAQINATDIHVTNSGFQSKMTAKATFSAAGSYDVVVHNPQSGQSATLPQGFSIL